MPTLDKQSPIPLYYQLYSQILEKIKTGELKPGDMLPTELSMMEEHSVSRATVRQAILDLSRNGYVIREKSKGTFIKDYTNHVGYKERARGFSAISSQGGTIPLTSRVLEQKLVIPPALIREELKLSEGESTFYLKRIRYIQEEANTFVEDWIPSRLCPGIEKENFNNASLYQILENKHGVIPHHAQRTFECSCASTEEQMRALEVKASTSLLLCESKVYSANGDPVEFYVALIKGKYTVQE